MRTHSSSRADFGVLSHVAGASLAAIVVLVPLAYGGTRPNALTALGWSLHVVMAVWILALAFERRKPDIAPVALWTAAALIAYVWARYIFFPTGGISPFTQAHFARIYDRWPESVILRTPSRMTLLTSGLVCGFLVAADVTRRTVWRRGLLYSMVTAGVAVTVLGLLQNATQAPGIYWESPRHPMPSQFFGTFYHFTSAGAFLNLTWPLAASMAFFSIRQHFHEGKPLLPGVVWGAAATAILLGHLGHVSRFPQVLAAAALLILVFVFRPLAGVTWTWRRSTIMAAVGLILGSGAVCVAVRSGKIHAIRSRWQMLHVFGDGQQGPLPPARVAWPSLMRDDLVVPYDHSHYFLGDRGAAYQFAVEAFTIQPFFGYGPGGWISAVSQHTNDPTIGTFYHYLQFTHEDFLQALVEWGIIGAVLGAILLVGGVWAAKRRIRMDRVRASTRPEVRPVIIGALAALFAVWAQALIDFPLQIPANALYACILLAMCWASAPLQLQPRKHVHE